MKLFTIGEKVVIANSLVRMHGMVIEVVRCPFGGMDHHVVIRLGHDEREEEIRYPNVAAVVEE